MKPSYKSNGNQGNSNPNKGYINTTPDSQGNSQPNKGYITTPGNRGNI
ncbi:hypothetical protein M8J76_016693 [Diaphorina citri]|nr:hypothetical protein M8J76_016693 [Diaphorina citri]